MCSIYIGLGFMVVKPHPVAMIQTPSGVYNNIIIGVLYIMCIIGVVLRERMNNIRRL